MEKRILDLNLLLMYLSGWEEESRKNPGEKFYRAWKGFLFTTLNTLADEKLIIQSKDTKSVILTEAGKQKAKQLQSQFFNSKGGSGGQW